VKVPLLDLQAQYEGIRGEIEAALRGVLESQRFILGPEVEALEAEIAAYCGASHAVACASGSDALLLALMAAGVGPGDEVLCPSYTFFATAGSVARLGARPVFADIDPATYNLDPEAARRVASRCTRLAAILPVHLFGRAFDAGPLGELAAELRIPLIEDAAQAIGASDSRGRRCGSLGFAGCFSFFPSKNLGAYGDGGILTTADDEAAERLRVLRVHGAKPKYHHHLVGLNSRLDALQAAVVRVKLRHLDRWTEGRQRNAARYDAAFLDAGACRSGEPLDEAELPLAVPAENPPGARHVYNQYVVRVPADRRDALRAFLAERGIGTEVYYPLGLHQQPCFADLGYRAGDLPATEQAADETLALPIYPELSEAQLDTVIGSVLDFLRGRS